MGDPDATEGTAPRGQWEVVASVLAAIGTGIGALGFVTFVGGTILWARFHGAGFAEEAVLSIVPSQDLIVIGAGALTPAVGIAFLALAILFLVETLFGTPSRWAFDAFSPRGRALFLALYVIAAEVVVFIVTVRPPSGLDIAIFAVAGVCQALLVGAIAYQQNSFPAFGAATFLSVGLFLGAAIFAAEIKGKQVRAAAFVRKDHMAGFGFFVAEGPNRVFLGRLEIRSSGDLYAARHPRLIAVTKAEITDLAIGPPEHPTVALVTGRRLAYELCRIKAPPAPNAKPNRQEGAAYSFNCWLPPRRATTRGGAS